MKKKILISILILACIIQNVCCQDLVSGQSEQPEINNQAASLGDKQGQDINKGIVIDENNNQPKDIIQGNDKTKSDISNSDQPEKIDQSKVPTEQIQIQFKTQNSIQKPAQDKIKQNPGSEIKQQKPLENSQSSQIIKNNQKPLQASLKSQNQPQSLKQKSQTIRGTQKQVKEQSPNQDQKGLSKQSGKQPQNQEQKGSSNQDKQDQNLKKQVSQNQKKIQSEKPIIYQQVTNKKQQKIETSFKEAFLDQISENFFLIGVIILIIVFLYAYMKQRDSNSRDHRVMWTERRSYESNALEVI